MQLSRAELEAELLLQMAMVDVLGSALLEGYGYDYGVKITPKENLAEWRSYARAEAVRRGEASRT